MHSFQLNDKNKSKNTYFVEIEFYHSITCCYIFQNISSFYIIFSQSY